MTSQFYVITGGPGSGKTPIIDRLAARGFATVAECGRAILGHQVAIGGAAVHWDDAVTYRELMLARGIADYERMQDEDRPVFFDRGITELVGYCHLIGMPVPDHVRKAAELYRYNTAVFVTPPWPEIYAHDALRKQDEDEAVRTYELCVSTYVESGYVLIEVPRLPVSDRIAFILATIDPHGPAD